MHVSIADLEEKDLIHRLLSDGHWRQRLLGLHGIPDDALVYQEVPLEGLGKLEGDIDILLVPPSRPESSTAIQVKRVKVSASTFTTNAPNKLTELRKLKNQANPLARIGFWQVYCFVLVVVDSRNNNAGVFSYEGLTPLLRAKIDKAISLEALTERVGLVHFEFVQPIEDPPLGAGTFFAHPKRMAQPTTQSAVVTTWIERAITRTKPNP